MPGVRLFYVYLFPNESVFSQKVIPGKAKEIIPTPSYQYRLNPQQKVASGLVIS